MQLKLALRLFVSPLVISLTSCASGTIGTVQIRTVHDFCLIAAPITYSEKHGADAESVDNRYDTDQTITDIKNHDLKFDSVCGTKGTVK